MCPIKQLQYEKLKLEDWREVKQTFKAMSFEGFDHMKPTDMEGVLRNNVYEAVKAHY